VGLIQVRALEPSFQNAEWGFALGRRYWGTGLFPDAARLLLDFAFTTIGVHRLEARTPVANERARRALQRMGAVFEGALRRSFLLAGQYHDDALYSLLASDWERQPHEEQPSVA
jgi:ribosomal-protein-alanine N-acetyltransferase